MHVRRSWLREWIWKLQGVLPKDRLSNRKDLRKSTTRYYSIVSNSGRLPAEIPNLTYLPHDIILTSDLASTRTIRSTSRNSGRRYRDGIRRQIHPKNVSVS